MACDSVRASLRVFNAEGNTHPTTVSSVTIQGETPYTLGWLVETFGTTAGMITHDYTLGAEEKLVLTWGMIGLRIIQSHRYNLGLKDLMKSNHNMRWFDKIKTKARELKKETYALAMAYRHPQTPWYAKVFAAVVVAYAFSPIDLIPDFIPVLGYLDDLILVPLGITLALKMIPDEILEEARARAADEFKDGKPRNWTVGAVIILIWVVFIGMMLYLILRRIGALPTG